MTWAMATHRIGTSDHRGTRDPTRGHSNAPYPRRPPFSTQVNSRIHSIFFKNQQTCPVFFNFSTVTRLADGIAGRFLNRPGGGIGQRRLAHGFWQEELCPVYALHAGIGNRCTASPARCGAPGAHCIPTPSFPHSRLTYYTVFSLKTSKIIQFLSTFQHFRAF